MIAEERFSSDSVEPFSHEAEMSIIGAAMIDERAARYLSLTLKPEMFHMPAHRILARAISDLAISEGGAPNWMPVMQWLKDHQQYDDAGGEDYLMKIVEYVPSAANFRFYGNIVLDKFARRELSERAERLSKAALSGNLKELLQGAHEIAKGLDPEGSETYCTSDDDPPEAAQSGITTCLPSLDRLGEDGKGFPRSELTLIGAFPSNGKTAFMASTCVALAQKGLKVAYATLEMDGWRIKRRMVQSLCGWAATPMTEQCRFDYEINVEEVKSLQIKIWDPSKKRGGEKFSDSLVSWALDIKEVYGLDILFIDYAQLFYRSGRQENRTTELQKVADDFLFLAKQAQCAVVAGAQLKLESGVAHIKDCRTFTAHAGLEIHLTLPPLNQRPTDRGETWPATIEVTKSRYGVVGEADCAFNWRYQKFEEAR